MSTVSPVRRSSARVVLVDADNRVLLLRGGDPKRPGPAVWHTPGGGIDPGETAEHAAMRELSEEVGLQITDVGPLVWTRRFQFSFDGVGYDQDEVFYLVRVHTHAVDDSGQTPLERRYLSGHRWFTVAELRSFGELVAPPDLADQLHLLLRDGPPSAPIEVGPAVMP
ncbi:MAG: NUDIX hydrolase [Actinomycetia bacterium]|nr:NUDIX hydrolase [Actinomycetes bacterium]